MQSKKFQAKRSLSPSPSLKISKAQLYIESYDSQKSYALPITSSSMNPSFNRKAAPTRSTNNISKSQRQREVKTHKAKIYCQCHKVRMAKINRVQLF